MLLRFLRFYTAAGDDVGQYLCTIKTQVCCECHQAVARMLFATDPAKKRAEGACAAGDQAGAEQAEGIDEAGAPDSKGSCVSTNPVRDFEQFAFPICEEERQRDLSPDRLRRPLGEMHRHVTQREIELQRHRAASLAAGRKTGHEQSEVERRVVELVELCEKLLLWERDAPRLTQEQLRERQSSASCTGDPAGDYLISLLNQFAGPWQRVQDLAAAYDGTVASEEGRQAEAGGADSDQAGAERAEGAGESSTPLEPKKVGLTDRQELILETMLEHQITSERRRENRQAIVRKINPRHKWQNYGRDFAALVKSGFLKSREGPEGGVWMSPQGKAQAESLRSEK
jgi:hypothetical protein